MKKLLTLTLCGVSALLTAEPVNLIKNGSFEEGLDSKGVPKYWRNNSGKTPPGTITLTTQNATHGKYALHLNKTARRGSLCLTQNVRLKTNTDYLLTVKGKRQAGYRWHYIGIRMPDSKVRAEGKISTDGKINPQVRFVSDPQKTLCYVNLALWGYNDNNPATVGEMWIDEVKLIELPRNAGHLNYWPIYAFTNDRIEGELFTRDYQGELHLELRSKATGKKFYSGQVQVKPGKNKLNCRFRNAPTGEAVLSLTSPDKVINLTHKILIQKKGF